MITKNATRIARDRKVTYSWDGPAIEDAKDPGWNTRIDLVIEHVKNAKCYTATVYKLAARRDPRGYTIYDVQRLRISGRAVHEEAGRTIQRERSRALRVRGSQ